MMNADNHTLEIYGSFFVYSGMDEIKELRLEIARVKRQLKENQKASIAMSAIYGILILAVYLLSTCN